jgi:hypothetical protein
MREITTSEFNHVAGTEVRTDRAPQRKTPPPSQTPSPIFSHSSLGEKPGACAAGVEELHHGLEVDLVLGAAHGVLGFAVGDECLADGFGQ